MSSAPPRPLHRSFLGRLAYREAADLQLSIREAVKRGSEPDHTSEAIEAIAEEQHVQLAESLIRKLVDYEVLAPAGD